MIKEFEFYHGLVFARLIHATQREILLKQYPTSDNASYVLDNKVGIYIKYSAKRMSPWRFSFQKRHQDEILEMKNKIGEVFLLLACDDDGIVALSFDELKKILNDNHEPVEWISVTRGRREMFSVKGSDGALDFKIGRDDFTKKIVEALNLKSKNVSSSIFSWFDK